MKWTKLNEFLSLQLHSVELDWEWIATDLLVARILFTSSIFHINSTKLFAYTWYSFQPLDIPILGTVIYFYFIYLLSVLQCAISSCCFNSIYLYIHTVYTTIFQSLYESHTHTQFQTNNDDINDNSAPEIGCLVNGLYLDGASWCHTQHHLIELKNGLVYDKMATVSELQLL